MIVPEPLLKAAEKAPMTAMRGTAPPVLSFTVRTPEGPWTVSVFDAKAGPMVTLLPPIENVPWFTVIVPPNAGLST